MEKFTKKEWEERRSYLKKKLTELIGGFPERTPLNPVVVERIDEGDFFREKVYFWSELNELVPAFVLIPRKLKRPAPGILALHQHNGQFEMGKSEVVGLIGDPNQAYARELAQRGYVVISPDFKCFEERRDAVQSGMFYERFEAMKAIIEGKTLQRRYLWDTMRALDYLVSREEVDGNRIGCIGHSLGGQQAWFSTLLDERIKVAVSSCGVSTLRAILDHHVIHNFAIYVPYILMVTDFDELTGLIAPRPYLMFNGANDWIFPIKGVEKIQKKAAEIYALYNAQDHYQSVVYPGEHSFPPENRQKAYQWFDRWL